MHARLSAAVSCLPQQEQLFFFFACFAEIPHTAEATAPIGGGTRGSHRDRRRELEWGRAEKQVHGPEDRVGTAHGPDLLFWAAA